MRAYIESTTLESPFSAARDQLTTMEAHLQSGTALRSSHDELEAFVINEGRELERRLLQAHLDLRGEREVRIVPRAADTVPRDTIRTNTSRPLGTLVGAVRVSRWAYQAEGVPGLHPADAALNLPGGLYSHGVRREAAENAAICSFDETVTHLEKCTGATVPKRQVEELTQRAAQDFDDFYRLRACVAEDTKALLVLTFDGKGIAMHTSDLRPATRKAALASKPKLGTRVTSGEKKNRKRMAQVAAIYSIDRFERCPMDILHELRHLRDVKERRPQPFNKRVWASVLRDPRDVICEAFAEGLRRDPEKKRDWVVLVDGDKDQLQIVRQEAKKAGVPITIVLDIIHVLEYLWKAAHCFYEPGSTEAEDWVSERHLMLLQGRSGGYVARGMRRLAESRGLDKKKRATVEKSARYLVNKTKILKYDKALSAGIPIATGVIEGACRHLIQDRMGRTGARWRLPSAEAVVRLRALRSSGDFDEYWKFHCRQEYMRQHAALYLEDKVPDPIRQGAPQLRVVK